MKIQYKNPNDLIPFETNPRKNQNIDKIAKSLKEYGFQQPIVVDKEMVVIVGHTRLLASKSINLKEVPVVIADLPEDKAKAYRLADNRLNEDSEWDYFLLTQELKGLEDIGFDLKLTGFEDGELDNMLSFSQNDDLSFNDLSSDQSKYTKSLIFEFEDVEKYQLMIEKLSDYIHKHNLNTNEEALEKLLINDQEVIH